MERTCRLAYGLVVVIVVWGEYMKRRGSVRKKKSNVKIKGKIYTGNKGNRGV